MSELVPGSPVQVVHFQRYRLPNISFSMETSFETVRTFLPSDITAQVSVARFPSRGVVRRLMDMVVASLQQGDVNHITGDAHYLSLLLKGRRTIVTVHDCAFLGNPSRWRRALLFLLWYRIPLSRVAEVTVVSDFTRHQLVTLIPRLSGRVHTIPTCVSPAFQPHSRTFRTEKPTILQVGTSPNKNVERVIEAIRGMSCMLHVIGSLTPKQIEALEESGVQYRNSVNLSVQELVQSYNECDLVTFCSTFEGFGMPIVEAQLVGRPVVTSRTASMPEIAGEGACLIDPFDPMSIREGIERVVRDATYRAELIRRGAQNAQRFAPTKVANAYADLYREIARRNAQ